MAWGDRAAEQHEQDQPSEISCVRPNGVKPEMEPLAGRGDFETRMRMRLGRKRLLEDLRLDVVGRDSDLAKRNLPYADDRMRAADSEMDQLVLMRATQILEEREARRREVTAKLRKQPKTQFEVLERMNEMVLDAEERRGD